MIHNWFSFTYWMGRLGYDLVEKSDMGKTYDKKIREWEGFWCVLLSMKKIKCRKGNYEESQFGRLAILRHDWHHLRKEMSCGMREAGFCGKYISPSIYSTRDWRECNAEFLEVLSHVQFCYNLFKEGIKCINSSRSVLIGFIYYFFRI